MITQTNSAATRSPAMEAPTASPCSRKTSNTADRTVELRKKLWKNNALSLTGTTPRRSGANNLLDSSRYAAIEERSTDLARSHALPLTLPRPRSATLSKKDASLQSYPPIGTTLLLCQEMDAPMLSARKDFVWYEAAQDGQGCF